MGGQVKRVADRIRPAPRARDTRRVQEWAEHQDYRRRACRGNQRDAPALRRDVRDSVISKDRRKVR